MNPNEIRRLRTQSILKELLPKAFGELDDEVLKSLCVVDVECKKGRYDAFVYLDKMNFSDQEQKYILSHLKRIKTFLQNYCCASEGWFRSPNFHFRFDESLEYQNKIDKLFNQISKELNRG